VRGKLPPAELKHTWTTRDFRLESGQTLPELTLAYESYGRLAADGRNAILVTHGFTSSQHAAGKHAPTDAAPGWAKWGPTLQKFVEGLDR